MKVGGQRKLHAPPELAYGSGECPGRVPPSFDSAGHRPRAPERSLTSRGAPPRGTDVRGPVPAHAVRLGVGRQHESPTPRTSPSVPSPMRFITYATTSCAAQSTTTSDPPQPPQKQVAARSAERTSRACGARSRGRTAPARRARGRLPFDCSAKTAVAPARREHAPAAERRRRTRAPTGSSRPSARCRGRSRPRSRRAASASLHDAVASSSGLPSVRRPIERAIAVGRETGRLAGSRGATRRVVLGREADVEVRAERRARSRPGRTCRASCR